jgi:hypothetical protein
MSSIPDCSARVQHESLPGVSLVAMRWLAAVRGVSHAERTVLFFLAVHYNEKRGCAWPNQVTIASECEMKQPNVSRAITSLESKGFISVERGARNIPLRYALNLSVTEAVVYHHDMSDISPRYTTRKTFSSLVEAPTDHIMAIYGTLEQTIEHSIVDPTYQSEGDAGPLPATTEVKGDRASPSATTLRVDAERATASPEQIATAELVGVRIVHDDYRCPRCKTTCFVTINEHSKRQVLMCDGDHHLIPWWEYKEWFDGRRGTREIAEVYVA